MNATVLAASANVDGVAITKQHRSGEVETYFCPFVSGFIRNATADKTGVLLEYVTSTGKERYHFMHYD